MSKLAEILSKAVRELENKQIYFWDDINYGECFRKSGDFNQNYIKLYFPELLLYLGHDTQRADGDFGANLLAKIKDYCQKGRWSRWWQRLTTPIGDGFRLYELAVLKEILSALKHHNCSKAIKLYQCSYLSEQITIWDKLISSWRVKLKKELSHFSRMLHRFRSRCYILLSNIFEHSKKSQYLNYKEFNQDYQNHAEAARQELASLYLKNQSSTNPSSAIKKLTDEQTLAVILEQWQQFLGLYTSCLAKPSINLPVTPLIQAHLQKVAMFYEGLLIEFNELVMSKTHTIREKLTKLKDYESCLLQSRAILIQNHCTKHLESLPLSLSKAQELTLFCRHLNHHQGQNTRLYNDYRVQANEIVSVQLDLETFFIQSLKDYPIDLSKNRFVQNIRSKYKQILNDKLASQTNLQKDPSFNARCLLKDIERALKDYTNLGWLLYQARLTAEVQKETEATNLVTLPGWLRKEIDDFFNKLKITPLETSIIESQKARWL